MECTTELSHRESHISTSQAFLLKFLRVGNLDILFNYAKPESKRVPGNGRCLINTCQMPGYMNGFPHVWYNIMPNGDSNKRNIRLLPHRKLCLMGKARFLLGTKQSVGDQCLSVIPQILRFWRWGVMSKNVGTKCYWLIDRFQITRGEEGSSMGPPLSTCSLT